MKIILIFTLFAISLLAWPASANEIVRGTTLTDGQQLYASDLHALIDTATIGAQFYNDAIIEPVLGGGQFFLVLDPANQVYYRIPAQTALYGNTNIFINAPLKALPSYGTLLFYDPTNNGNGICSVTASNLFFGQSSNINVAGFSFAYTNNTGTVQRLTPWPYPVFSGLNTNFPAYVLDWDTNGIPHYSSLSNFEWSVASDLGTNFSLGYTYNQMFQPWQVYGTNNYGFTNAWGSQTNWLIFSLFTNNVQGAATNVPTLVDADTLPVNSTQFQTNTSVTLGGIYQYLTNKNTLPPYTLARIQFYGAPASLTVTNAAIANGIITNIAAAVNWTTPTAVSFAGAATMIATTPQIVSNTCYYALFTNSAPTTGFQLYTNYATALLRTNAILGGGFNPSVSSTMYWVTNITSYNADVIQSFNGTSARTGEYDIYFRTNGAGNLYYVTGTPISAGFGFFEIPSDNIFQSNTFRVGFFDSRDNLPVVPAAAHVLVNPQ